MDQSPKSIDTESLSIAERLAEEVLLMISCWPDWPQNLDEIERLAYKVRQDEQMKRWDL